MKTSKEPKPAKPNMDREILATIDANPKLLSFLYDVDMMPEQLTPGTPEWGSLVKVVSGFVIGKAVGMAEPKDWRRG